MPPLFVEGPQRTGAHAGSADGAGHRDLIRKELGAGVGASFLLRSVKRHGVKAAAIILTAWLAPLALFVYLFAVRRVGRWAYVLTVVIRIQVRLAATPHAGSGLVGVVRTALAAQVGAVAVSEARRSISSIQASHAGAIVLGFKGARAAATARA